MKLRATTAKSFYLFLPVQQPMTPKSSLPQALAETRLSYQPIRNVVAYQLAKWSPLLFFPNQIGSLFWNKPWTWVS